ncbi:MAG TPA: hypothetical protein PK813_01240 [Candidatus Hydrogenedens sp.]|nr:hypothetical protein [Candidatus Hydrogenedens sp.]
MDTKVRTKKTFKLIIILCLWFLPIFIIVCIEFSLRILNVGENRNPFLEKECNQTHFFVPNRSFYQQYFRIPLYDFVNWDHLDFSISKQKDKNAFRIFVFGESAMYGLESSVRQLEVMLKMAIPEIKWEIYNVSCPGINSHILYFLAKACVYFSPDAFLIYMGNNETIGPYGEHSFLYKFPALRTTSVIRLDTWLKKLRIVQLFEKQPDIHWREQTPDNLMPFVPHQGQETKTLELFEKNLKDMINIGIKTNAYVVLGTLSFNRKFGVDPSEYKSLSFQQTEMNKRILAVGNTFKTQTHLIRLVDLDKTIAQKSPDGIPGYEYFCDNIHFTFEGNYIVAQEWFNAVLSILKEKKQVSLENNTLSIPIEKCAEYLGWNKANMLLLIQMQKNVITDAVSLKFLQKKEEEVSKEIGDFIEQLIVDGYKQAYEINPEDEKINMQLIEWLLKIKDLNKAMEISQLFYSRYPCSRIAMRLLGNVYANTSDIDNAIKIYQECLTYYPDDGLAKDSLNRMLKLKHETK